MILANVNVGTGPGNNDGESLYSAFTKVNNNFANVQSNVNSLSSSVTSVAGKTGNVQITVNDIIGFNGASIVNTTAPASNSSAGSKGQIVVSGSYMYVCTAANTWVRVGVTTSW